MASKCFYLILHSVLFIIPVFVAQVLSDSDGHYHVQDARHNVATTFIPLLREERQVVETEKKPDEPLEDKGKLTKKPTALDTKTTPSPPSESGSEKARLAAKKESTPAGFRHVGANSSGAVHEGVFDSVRHVGANSSGAVHDVVLESVRHVGANSSGAVHDVVLESVRHVGANSSGAVHEGVFDSVRHVGANSSGAVHEVVLESVRHVGANSSGAVHEGVFESVRHVGANAPATSQTPENDHREGTQPDGVNSSTVSPQAAKTSSKPTDPVVTNITVPDPDIQISKMFDMDFEKTIKEHNITEKQDHHLYYNSSFVVDPELGKKYWVDLDKQKNVKVSDVLSQAYRRAMTVKLSFDFPFYGHLIRNITIATGGFLYTGDYVHSWLAATQYIAPLMANFDTSLSNHSFVKYVDNGTAFTVQWENVILQEKPDKGGFTFQCTLHKNGDIVFVYQQVAVVIGDIDDDQHPVKVGLSDAYIIDRTIFFVRRKTIYEYHRVHFHKEDIRNWTVIVLNALDTCLDMKDCHSCLTQLKNFRCNWCANRCSNGMDRHRQDWITNGCDSKKVKDFEECANEDYFQDFDKPRSSAILTHPEKEHVPDEGRVNIGIAGIMGILFIVCLGLGTGIWLFYAYRNPHTPAGQFLIRYRPSQWSWRRGEARYTAATIHM